MLNEIRSKVFRRITQSLTFLPFFISWVVVGLFATFILDYDNGIINQTLASLGLEKVQFYSEPAYWPFILMFVSIWKGVGYSAVIYLATMSGFSDEYYEAARIDGASRLQEIMKITLPLLYPTVIILTLLAIGNIMRSDFGLFYFVTSDQGMLYPTTDVIDTFVYKGVQGDGQHRDFLRHRRVPIRYVSGLCVGVQLDSQPVSRRLRAVLVRSEGYEQVSWIA